MLDDLDIDAGELTGAMSATINKGLFADQNPGIAAPDSVDLTIVGLYRSTTAVQVPLGDSQDQSVLTQSATVPVRLEAWGSSASFPHDVYGSNNFLLLQTSAGAVTDPTVQVEMSQKLAPFNAEASVGGIYFNFLLERPTERLAWTYVIALSPLVLLAALILFSLTHRQTAGTSALEVVVGLFALLPLRQVLVPPDIAGMTLLDTLLGLELITFIAWLVFAILYLDHSAGHVRNKRQRRPSRSSPTSWP